MDEHDEFECEDCTKRTAMVNGHHILMVVPCSEGDFLWLCESCETSEQWGRSDDLESMAKMIKSLIDMHCIDHLALVVE